MEEKFSIYSGLVFNGGVMVVGDGELEDGRCHQWALVLHKLTRASGRMYSCVRT